MESRQTKAGPLMIIAAAPLLFGISAMILAIFNLDAQATVIVAPFICLAWLAAISGIVVGLREGINAKHSRSWRLAFLAGGLGNALLLWTVLSH